MKIAMTANFKERMEQRARDAEAAKERLSKQYDLPRDAKFDRAWEIAWERSHACGFHEVEDLFRDLVDLLK